MAIPGGFILAVVRDGAAVVHGDPAVVREDPAAVHVGPALSMATLPLPAMILKLSAWHPNLAAEFVDISKIIIFEKIVPKFSNFGLPEDWYRCSLSAPHACISSEDGGGDKD